MSIFWWRPFAAVLNATFSCAMAVWDKAEVMKRRRMGGIVHRRVRVDIYPGLCAMDAKETTLGLATYTQWLHWQRLPWKKTSFWMQSTTTSKCRTLSNGLCCVFQSRQIYGASSWSKGHVWPNFGTRSAAQSSWRVTSPSMGHTLRGSVFCGRRHFCVPRVWQGLQVEKEMEAWDVGWNRFERFSVVRSSVKWDMNSE